MIRQACVVFFCFFFFKQKTAYEMRISDWSSDVCSSDLNCASSLALWKRERCGCFSAVISERLAASRDFAKSAAVSVAAHVEMEMIIVGGVVIGAQHRAEPAAGRFVQGAQELLRALVAVPAAVEHDPPPVGEHEARDVDRVRRRMLRQPARAPALDVAAAIGELGR